MKRLLGRLRDRFSERSEDVQTREEMRLHIEMETERNLRAGMTAAEARRRALVSFGVWSDGGRNRGRREASDWRKRSRRSRERGSSPPDVSGAVPRGV